MKNISKSLKQDLYKNGIVVYQESFSYGKFYYTIRVISLDGYLYLQKSCNGKVIFVTNLIDNQNEVVANSSLKKKESCKVIFEDEE